MENNITRLDKGIISNQEDIYNVLGNDYDFAISLLLFFAKKCTANLFGKIEFTTTDLCKFLNVDNSALTKRHPDIEGVVKNKTSINNDKNTVKKIKVKDTMVNGRPFVSVLDYTLMKMMRNNIVLSKTSNYEKKDTKGNVIYGQKESFEGFQLINKIEILRERTENFRLPIAYSIKLNPFIYNNLFTQFYQIDYVGYIKVGQRRGGLERRKIYLMISWWCSLVASKKNYKDCFERTVDQWIKYIANYDEVNVILDKENGWSSFRKKEYLDRKFKIVKTEASGHIDFTYTFVAHTPKSEEYILQVWVNEITVKRFENTKAGKFQNALFGSLYEKFTFTNVNKINALSSEKEIYQAFNDWLISNENINVKIDVVKEKMMLSFNRKLSDEEAAQFLVDGLDFIYRM